MTVQRVPTVLGPFGRFVIERRLGEGQASVVYQARDRDSGEHVALKLFRAGSLDGDTLTRIEHEFSVLVAIKHANLVALYDLFLDADEEDGERFFTMELVQGTDFLAYVRRDVPARRDRRESGLLLGQPVQRAGVSSYAPCTPAGVLRLRGALPGLIAGVSAMHASGLVHRDLRPANVRVTPEGRVVVLDLGLAIRSGPGAGMDGDLIGTAAYMAPEQWEHDAVGPASDWYAVGVMLFEALTGALPFSGSAQEIFVRKRTVGAPQPGLLVDGIPADLDDLCAALLRTTPGSRPAGPEIASRLGV